VRTVGVHFGDYPSTQSEGFLEACLSGSSPATLVLAHDEHNPWDGLIETVDDLRRSIWGVVVHDDEGSVGKQAVEFP
jgi:hypothetical protein